MTFNLAPLRPVIALFFAQKRGMLLAGALLAGITVLSGIALLALSGWFITATAIAGLVPGAALVFDVFAPSAAIRFLAMARTASRYGERLTTHDATFAILSSLRETLFRGWARPRAAQALLRQPAKLLFRLTADIDALDSLYLRVLVPGAVAIVAAVAAGIALGTMQPLLGAFVCAFLLIVGLGIPVVAAMAAQKPGRRRAHALEALRSRSIDLLAGQTELLMAGRLQAQVDAVESADIRMADAEDALNRVDTGVAIAFGTAGALLLAAVLWAMSLLVEHKLIGAPIAALGLLVAFAAMEPFAALRRGALELGRTVLAAGRIAPRLLLSAGSNVRPEPRPGIALDIDHVSLRHEGSSSNLATGISLTIACGERVALIGRSGAGKSTLLGLIAGEMEPIEGHVANLGTVLLTQRTELFCDSLRDNLRLADPGADDTRLMGALTAAGLAEHVIGLPLGLDTRFGEGGAGLSGGQSRRLALARFLLRDEPLWLLDEPTEGLDGEVARDVLARIAARASGHTIIIATHIRREAMLADRLIILENGVISADFARGKAGFDTALSRLRPD